MTLENEVLMEGQDRHQNRESTGGEEGGGRNRGEWEESKVEDNREGLRRFLGKCTGKIYRSRGKHQSQGLTLRREQMRQQWRCGTWAE
jgi:hypothetical protein